MTGELFLNIKQEYSNLSKGQKAIASYILENYDKAAFMTAGALGRQTGVSESTVVRFACTMGYEGYPQLQRALQEIIKNRLTNLQRLNIMDGVDAEKIADTVLRMEISNLKATRANLDVGMLKGIASDISRARKVYVLGFRSSAPLAQFLVYYMNYITDKACLITNGASDVYSYLVHASCEDVVIGVGFPRYSLQTVDGLAFAREKGAKIVAITDNELSPLYKLSDVCIFAKSDINSFVDSLVAPLSILNALIIMLGLENKPSLVENFIEMENIWQNKHVYSKDDEE